MNAVARAFSALFLVLLLNVFLLAQKQPAPEPPQTPRQALIEIIKGDGKSMMKHLTVEVQELLGKQEYAVGLPTSMGFGNWTRRAGAEVQPFDNGLVLLSVNDPKTQQKFEIHVNTDAMSGDSDTMELSFHFFHDGEEQQTEWQPALSRFAVTLVMQKGIWRLSKLEAGVEFLIGDPEFLKKTVLKSFDEAAKEAKKAKEQRNMENDGEPSPDRETSPDDMLRLLGYAEMSYAGQHPDVGFTCSLSQLAEVAKSFNMDPQIATGVANGYRINLTGCQGHPAGSYQITAEPIKGGKAYCTDATHNVRVADDGRVFTCLTAGRLSRPVQSADDDEESTAIGVGVSTPTPPDKPEEQ